jgi:hypothetical protein
MAKDPLKSTRYSLLPMYATVGKAPSRALPKMDSKYQLVLLMALAKALAVTSTKPSRGSSDLGKANKICAGTSLAS